MISLKFLPSKCRRRGCDGPHRYMSFPEHSLSCFDIRSICLIQPQYFRLVVIQLPKARIVFLKVSSVHRRGDDVCRTGSNQKQAQLR